MTDKLSIDVDDKSTMMMSNSTDYEMIDQDPSDELRMKLRIARSRADLNESQKFLRRNWGRNEIIRNQKHRGSSS